MDALTYQIELSQEKLRVTTSYSVYRTSLSSLKPAEQIITITIRTILL